MNETLVAISETLRAILKQHCTSGALRDADSGTFAKGLWTALDEAGVLLSTVPEAQGGLGLGLAEASHIARVVAAHAGAVPVAETMLAHWLWHQGQGANVEPATAASGRLTLHVAQDLAPELAEAVAAGRALGATLYGVAWARHADTLVLVVPDSEHTRLVRVALAGNARITPRANLADEPRDDVRLEGVTVAAHDMRALALSCGEVEALFALMRAAQIVGAMEAAVDISVQYANERVQFGRPIGKFQAIQSHIAGMAELLASASVALEQAAASATDRARTPLLWVAKALASESAGQIAAVAHQVHGAIGFTREYRLQPLTRRLWAWREEQGNEAYWQEKLGALVLRNGADALWPWLTQISPSARAGQG